MIQIEITADNIDFASLISALEPLLDADSKSKMSGIKSASLLMPKAMKERAAVEIFNSDKLDIKSKAQTAVDKTGVSADIVSIKAKAL